MANKAFTSEASWSWPTKEPDFAEHEEASPCGSFDSDQWETDDGEDIPTQEANQPQHQPQSQKQYSPRTCRICLEVVLPSYETAPQGLGGMLSPAPKVKYISSEPESGRLIRPCKCKGSQRYVHEGCLQAWRYADPSYGRRNYFECPTCKFRYRLERMRWSRWIQSTLAQIALTLTILFITVFGLGFVADPIINLYLDPIDTLTTNPFSSRAEYIIPGLENEDPTWVEHIIKGLASLGLLGFVKIIFAMSPWQWYNLRNSGILNGGRHGRAATGRDRLESVSWWLITVGVFTFLWAVWKGVRAWSRKALEKAGDHVADVQGDDEDDLEDDVTVEGPELVGSEDVKRSRFKIFGAATPHKKRS